MEASVPDKRDLREQRPKLGFTYALYGHSITFSGFFPVLMSTIRPRMRRKSTRFSEPGPPRKTQVIICLRNVTRGRSNPARMGRSPLRRWRYIERDLLT